MQPRHEVHFNLYGNYVHFYTKTMGTKNILQIHFAKPQKISNWFGSRKRTLIVRFETQYPGK